MAPPAHGNDLILYSDPHPKTVQINCINLCALSKKKKTRSLSQFLASVSFYLSSSSAKAVSLPSVYHVSDVLFSESVVCAEGEGLEQEINLAASSPPGF